MTICFGRGRVEHSQIDVFRLMDQIDLKKAHIQFVNYLQSTCMLSPRTVENHEKAFELLLRRFPELTSNMLDEDHLTEFFAWLQTRRRMVGRGMSAAGIKKGTVATYWRRLNRFFGWLCMRRIIAQNPLRAEGMRCPKV